MKEQKETVMLDVVFNSGVKGVVRYEGDSYKDTGKFLESFIENWENARIWEAGEWGATVEICGTYIDTVDLRKVLGYRYC